MTRLQKIKELRRESLYLHGERGRIERRIKKTAEEINKLQAMTNKEYRKLNINLVVLSSEKGFVIQSYSKNGSRYFELTSDRPVRRFKIRGKTWKEAEITLIDFLKKQPKPYREERGE